MTTDSLSFFFSYSSLYCQYWNTYEFNECIESFLIKIYNKLSNCFRNFVCETFSKMLSIWNTFDRRKNLYRIFILESFATLKSGKITCEWRAVEIKTLYRGKFYTFATVVLFFAEENGRLDELDVAPRLDKSFTAGNCFWNETRQFQNVPTTCYEMRWNYVQIAASVCFHFKTSITAENYIRFRLSDACSIVCELRAYYILSVVV